jgi:hypothetical protein
MEKVYCSEIYTSQIKMEDPYNDEQIHVKKIGPGYYVPISGHVKISRCISESISVIVHEEIDEEEASC